MRYFRTASKRGRGRRVRRARCDGRKNNRARGPDFYREFPGPDDLGAIYFGAIKHPVQTWIVL